MREPQIIVKTHRPQFRDNNYTYTRVVIPTSYNCLQNIHVVLIIRLIVNITTKIRYLLLKSTIFEILRLVSGQQQNNGKQARKTFKLAYRILYSDIHMNAEATLTWSATCYISSRLKS